MLDVHDSSYDFVQGGTEPWYFSVPTQDAIFSIQLNGILLFNLFDTVSLNFNYKLQGLHILVFIQSDLFNFHLILIR